MKPMLQVLVGEVLALRTFQKLSTHPQPFNLSSATAAGQIQTSSIKHSDSCACLLGVKGQVSPSLACDTFNKEVLVCIYFIPGMREAGPSWTLCMLQV